MLCCSDSRGTGMMRRLRTSSWLAKAWALAIVLAVLAGPCFSLLTPISDDHSDVTLAAMAGQASSPSHEHRGDQPAAPDDGSADCHVDEVWASLRGVGQDSAAILAARRQVSHPIAVVASAAAGLLAEHPGSLRPWALPPPTIAQADSVYALTHRYRL